MAKITPEVGDALSDLMRENITMLASAGMQRLAHDPTLSDSERYQIKVSVGMIGALLGAARIGARLDALEAHIMTMQQELAALQRRGVVPS